VFAYVKSLDCFQSYRTEKKAACPGLQEEHGVQAHSAAGAGFWRGVCAHARAPREKAHPVSLLAPAPSTLFSLADKETKNDRGT